MKKSKPTDVDGYIAGFPVDVQERLKQVRAAVQEAAPQAEETIKYAMPAYVLHGNLVFFAAFTNHIGFYALPSGHEQFQKELARYKSGKGSVQFPFDEPLPVKLISRIVKFRIRENEDLAKAKAKQGKVK